MAAFPRVVLALALHFVVAAPVLAQVTTGSITGRITDQQGAAVPGVTVEARHLQNGFARTVVTDAEGAYRLGALPVGPYVVSADLQGFQPFEAPAVEVNVSRQARLDVVLQVAGRAETVTVRATIPLVQTRSSSVGEVVDLTRIQGLPLNGRQFANLAATVPGVGLGLHSEETKSAQFTPQIGGGNGRNVNYVVDGGDNNDDTVGGLLQLFPLEAIQEFNLITHRFDAEYGRSNGAVLNVVTRSGTNDLRGSWFTLARHEALNARTFSEELAGLEKQPYARYQYGGSLGGPIREDRVHYFAAYERTQQDTRQVVDTLGAFPDQEGVFDVPLRQNLFTGKVTASPHPSHFLALRYGRDHNTQAAGAALRTARSSWGESTNTFDSLNFNHNWVIGGSLLNEFVFQYSDFVNDIPAPDRPGPSYFLPNNVRGGTYAGAPQRTEQAKWQYRTDLSWTTSRLPGLSHEFRAGANWLHEPRLRVFTGQGVHGVFSLLQMDLEGPVSRVIVIGNDPTANFPLEQYGFYAQDDWRITDRLTANLGVRWDYVDGMPIDQSRSPNFQALQAAGRDGRLEGTLLDEFGQERQSDTDNIQPRLGAAFDVFGDGRDVIRGGWGLYVDFGYIASNALVAAFDAAQAGGLVFLAADPTGLRKSDGTFFRATDPLSTIDHLNLVAAGSPPAGEVVSPVLEQPYTRQANLGWAHQFGDNTVVSADYVRVDGRHLNMRVRPNVVVNGRRLLAGIPIQPAGSLEFRTALSRGTSRYDGLILAMRRRLSRGLDFSASYTLADATSTVGTAYDEITHNLIQDIRDPFGAVQQGPSARTDSRHLVSVSAIVRTPWVDVAPVFYYRSPLPVHTFEGVDINGDGNINDITLFAYRYTGLDDDGTATFEDAGPCGTVNCSRRAPFSQLNLRVSRRIPILGRLGLEAIAEVFNVFNARNPSLALTQRRLLQGRPNAGFMQPAAFAGDVGQPEQRVGQIGFRLTF